MLDMSASSADARASAAAPSSPPGLTGGGNGTHQVYLGGIPAHRLKDQSVVDHLVELVESKAREIEAAKHISATAAE